MRKLENPLHFEYFAAIIEGMKQINDFPRSFFSYVEIGSVRVECANMLHGQVKIPGHVAYYIQRELDRLRDEVNEFELTLARIFELDENNDNFFIDDSDFDILEDIRHDQQTNIQGVN